MITTSIFTSTEEKFDNWNSLKQSITLREKLPTFKQREIWWCNIGLNVGHEENGKNQDYSRPVLILRKFNNHIFFGITLTSQVKEKHYYHRINFKNKEQCIMISQLRLFDSKRLVNKMGDLSQKQFNEIREILKSLI